MSEKTHWLQSPNKNYLGHWDLPESGEIVLTIESAKWEEVKNPITKTSEGKRVVRWKEKGYKPLICNETNAKAIYKSSSIKNMEDSSGVQVCLFISKVTDRRAREEVDCIRIRPINPYSLEKLKVLFEKKKTKIDPSHINRFKSIIENKESSSYMKAFNHLNSL